MHNAREGFRFIVGSPFALLTQSYINGYISTKIIYPQIVILCSERYNKGVVTVKEVFVIRFQPLTIKEKALFDRYFREQRYENAHFNFTNLFMWRKIYEVQWAEEDGFLCVKAYWGGNHFFLPPFGPTENYESIIEKLEGYAKELGAAFEMRGVENFVVETLERIRPGYFSCKPDRDNFDYVYLAEDMIHFKGRKFHQKKNHANFFRKNYPHYEYRPMDAESALACIAFNIEWCKKRDCKKGDDLDCEKDAIIEALTNFDTLGFVGGVIYLDNEIKAFTFGEKINSDTVVVHVEKGDTDIRGIYPVINQDFCAANWESVTYINREEDMGVEGLRKAKESYNPVKMIEKSVVTVK